MRSRGLGLMAALAASTAGAYLAGCGDVRSDDCAQRTPTQGAPADAQDAGIESLGRNAGCYVCHTTFVGEKLTATHLEAGRGCVACHGPSVGHANDEHIGATPPDRVFSGDAVNPFCRECHPSHDVPPEAVIAHWLKRKPERAVASAEADMPTCTDCHGRHRIAQLEQAFE